MRRDAHYSPHAVPDAFPTLDSNLLPPRARPLSARAQACPDREHSHAHPATLHVRLIRVSGLALVPQNAGANWPALHGVMSSDGGGGDKQAFKSKAHAADSATTAKFGK